MLAGPMDVWTDIPVEIGNLNFQKNSRNLENGPRYVDTTVNVVAKPIVFCARGDG